MNPDNMPNIWMYGYKGDLYFGLYHWADVSLNTITQLLTAINIITLNALASFTIFSTSKIKIIIPMIMQVVIMLNIGVKYFGWILPINDGNRLSRAIANGNGDAVKTPLFAIEISVIAPRVAAAYPK